MKAQWGRTALMAILSLALVGGIAVAQEQQSYPNPPAGQTMPPADQMRQFQPLLERSKDLIGTKVTDRNGKELGSIKDIVLTPQREGISYVVLSYNGAFGGGSKLFAVPWSAFEVRPQEQGKKALIVLNKVDENYLKTAKGFDNDHWPMVANRSWPGIEVRNMPGEQPLATEPTTPGMTPAGADIKYLRLSNLTGLTVKNSENTDLGKLDNIVLDWHGGRVAYGILSVDRSFLGEGGKLAAIPWSVIRINPEQKVALLNVDKATLQTIAFDKDHFPNLASLQYSRDLFQRFNVRPYWETFGYVPSERNPSTTVHEGTCPGAEHNEHSQSMEGMNEPMD